MKSTPMPHGIVCWGSTEFGQDGHGIPATNRVEAVPFLQGLLDHGDIHGRIKLVACGSSHSVAVTESNEIFAWGNGSSGQIASPDMFSHRTPIKVTLHPPIPGDVTISRVACGMRHTMVLLSNGQVYAFGNNFFAQLGYDFQTESYKENQVKPLLLKNVLLKPVRQVSCGDKHSLFLFVDGSMAAVGNNSHGQLGDGTSKESVVPKPVDLDCTVKAIASGSNHNLAISGAGDVYVWGMGKGCGHRRHDVLGPELKLLGHDVLQVAGGGFHSLALIKSGDVYVWGFGTDGQLGLGDRVMTSGVPKRLRHKDLRGSVSQIDCGESYSAAVTRDGALYMWGRNSHCIEASESGKKSYSKPVCINPDRLHANDHHSNGDDRRDHRTSVEQSSVHSVHCGTWHAAVLLGTPDWIPDTDDTIDESESDEDDDNIDDDGMTSEGSGSVRSTFEDKNLNNHEDNVTGDFRLEGSQVDPGSSAPPPYTAINKATSPIKGLHSMSPLLFPSRAQTKLTIGEFYALTDSSPSESKNTTPKSSPRPGTNASGSKHSASPSPLSPRKEHHHHHQQQQQQQQHHHHHQQQQQQENFEMNNDTVLSVSIKHNVDDKENIRSSEPRHKPIPTYPGLHVSSPSTSPDFSVISESSLKKRMTENIELNKGIQFKNRDFSGRGRGSGQGIMSPLKPLDIRVTPSPDHLESPQGRLTPRASCRTKAASLTERAQTMFISKSTANHFLLPREQTFISKQSMSLMDLGNLRSGAVFDNQDSNIESVASSRGTSASHNFHSNANSRLSMVSPYTENDLREIISHKSADKRKLEAIQTGICMSDTPSNMMRYNRIKDMSGLDQTNLENPLKPNHVLFATPSPNFGSNQHITANGDLRNNMETHRSRTLYGLPHNKHYRKPGLPGVDVKTKVIRPGHLHGPSLHGLADGPSHHGKKDKLSEIPMHRTLEVTVPSINKQTPTAGGAPDININNNSTSNDGSDPTSLGYSPSQAFVNLTPRRVPHPTGSLWRTKTMTSQNHSAAFKPADLAIDVGALSSDVVASMSHRKEYPPIRSFHSKNSGSGGGGGGSGGGSGGSKVIKMKKNMFFEKAQTSLAISGAGTPGPKGQYLRQVNTSASSRNHRKL